MNKNNAFLDASDLKQIEKVLEDQAAVARQNEEFKKSVTPIGTASIKRRIFKAGKMKISGAHLKGTNQYYRIKPREPQILNQKYLEITRKNDAFLQVNKDGQRGIQDKKPLYK